MPPPQNHQPWGRWLLLLQLYSFAIGAIATAMPAHSWATRGQILGSLIPWFGLPTLFTLGLFIAFSKFCRGTLTPQQTQRLRRWVEVYYLVHLLSELPGIIIPFLDTPVPPVPYLILAALLDVWNWYRLMRELGPSPAAISAAEKRAAAAARANAQEITLPESPTASGAWDEAKSIPPTEPNRP